MTDKVKDGGPMINHPSYYNAGGIEAIDVIEAWDLGFHLGNVIKYVSRAGRKDHALIDLKKAHWYLERAIDFIMENYDEL